MIWKIIGFVIIFSAAASAFYSYRWHYYTPKYVAMCVMPGGNVMTHANVTHFKIDEHVIMLYSTDFMSGPTITMPSSQCIVSRREVE